MDVAELSVQVAPGSLLTSPTDLAVYSYDGALDRAKPDAVLIARTAEDVRRAVAWCAVHRVPFIARGAGTNLSGGCIPVKGGLVIALARLNRNVRPCQIGESTFQSKYESERGGF